MDDAENQPSQLGEVLRLLGAIAEGNAATFEELLPLV